MAPLWFVVPEILRHFGLKAFCHYFRSSTYQNIFVQLTSKNENKIKHLHNSPDSGCWLCNLNKTMNPNALIILMLKNSEMCKLYIYLVGNGGQDSVVIILKRNNTYLFELNFHDIMKMKMRQKMRIPLKMDPKHWKIRIRQHWIRASHTSVLPYQLGFKEQFLWLEMERKKMSDFLFAIFFLRSVLDHHFLIRIRDTANKNTGRMLTVLYSLNPYISDSFFFIFKLKILKVRNVIADNLYL